MLADLYLIVEIIMSVDIRTTCKGLTAGSDDLATAASQVIIFEGCSSCLITIYNFLELYEIRAEDELAGSKSYLDRLAEELAAERSLMIIIIYL